MEIISSGVTTIRLIRSLGSWDPWDLMHFTVHHIIWQLNAIGWHDWRHVFIVVPSIGKLLKTVICAYLVQVIDRRRRMSLVHVGVSLPLPAPLDLYRSRPSTASREASNKRAVVGSVVRYEGNCSSAGGPVREPNRLQGNSFCLCVWDPGWHVSWKWNMSIVTVHHER
jgi:hypothetical protein